MRRWVFALLLACGITVSAHAEERITDFFSDVKVELNGDLLVTERIAVNAEGQNIRRGLLRDFPTRYRRPDGTAVVIGFDVLGVSRDGSSEPYALENLANGVRIRMGSANTLLSEGAHVFEIKYRTTRQIGFFAEFDELYWNVTGNGWTFPIDHARARITLPQPIDLLQNAVYTGSQGSTDAHARVVSSGPGQIVFETTAPLNSLEGLTVAVAWPKGLIAAPSFGQILLLWIKDNLVSAIALAGFGLLAAYYLQAYFRTRRRSDPLVVPLYEAPAGMSAPAVRYVAQQGYDQTTFVVGMLELIATRAMRMVKKSETTAFERSDEKAFGKQAPLLDGMLTKLFRKDKRFVRDSLEGTRFEDARGWLETTLNAQYRDKLFNFHKAVVSKGRKLWLLYVVMCLGAAWWQDAQNAYLIMMSLAFSVPAILALTAVYGAWRKNGFSVIGVVLVLLFIGPFLLGGLALLLLMTRPHFWGALGGLMPLLLLPVIIRSSNFLRGYTEEGYAVMDKIEGFKRYLTLAEGPRLQALVTPAEQLEVYERFLPYAVALDVGRAWSAAFAGMFTGVAAMAAVDAMQRLYGGHDMLNDDPSRMIRGIARDLQAPPSEEVSSSSTAPGSSGSWSSSGSSSSSSSSGSSGGGSSGGGGGGGGGSGW